MPKQWINVLSHPSTKDKAALLERLKYSMTIADVHDLAEYQEYENWMNFEEYKKQKSQNNNMQSY